MSIIQLTPPPVVPIKVAAIGGVSIDYITDPRLGRDIRVGHPAIDQIIMVLFNRLDAVVRENIELHERLAKLDGFIKPEPGAPGTIVGSTQQQQQSQSDDDPFSKAVEMAAKVGQGAPVNGTNRTAPKGAAPHGDEEGDPEAS